MDVVDRHAAAQTSCVSKCQPFGNSGRIGRSIIRAVSVAFSPERPSRRKKEPGILPGGVVALLDVDGQRQEVDVAEVAHGRGGRAPSCRRERTTTAPLAWRASLPVSKEISSPPTSAETRLTSNMLM